MPMPCASLGGGGGGGLPSMLRYGTNFVPSCFKDSLNFLSFKTLAKACPDSSPFLMLFLFAVVSGSTWIAKQTMASRIASMNLVRIDIISPFQNKMKQK